MSNINTNFKDLIFKGLMGHGSFTYKENFSIWEKLFSFLEITRPLLLLMAAPLAGSGAALALGTIPPLKPLIIGIIIPVISTAGIHAFNDWVDRERDKKAWPGRPIPSGRIKPHIARIYALSLMAISLVITLFYFNIYAFLVLLIALGWGVLYCLKLRDMWGYLSLPPIIALFPIGGWVAFSPHTLFSHSEPWILGLFVIFWQAGHIMVHSPAHPVIIEEGRVRTEKKALFFYPSPALSAWLGFIFNLLTLATALYLLKSPLLDTIYALMMIPIGILNLIAPIVLIKKPDDKERAMTAFNIATGFMFFTSTGIVADIAVKKGISDYVLLSSDWLKFIANFVFDHHQLISFGFKILFIFALMALVLISLKGMLKILLQFFQSK